MYKRQLEGNPVTIRFLDPPLHEFVPTEEEDIKKLADAQGKTVEQIKAIIDSLHEFNPMMGHRGCRLDVYKRQANTAYQITELSISSTLIKYIFANYRLIR